MIDNAPSRAGLQQRQQRLRNEIRSEDIGFVGLAERVTCNAAKIERDASVVDENVQAPELRFKESRKRGNIGFVGDVNLHSVRVNAFGFQLARRFIRFRLVSRTQRNRDALLSELARDFKTQSFVGSSDKRDFIRMHFSLPSWWLVNCGYWLAMIISRRSQQRRFAVCRGCWWRLPRRPSRLQ